jgi:aminobenzoyl-glutamate utilization protein B
LPSYTPEEEEFARALQKSCGAPEIGMDREIQPLGPGSTGVTDNSEYSWFAPFAMASIACVPPGVGWHNWQVNAAANSGLGWKGMLLAAKLLMATGVDLSLDEGVIEEAQEEFKQRIGEKYRPLMEEKSRRK